ncbi:hypothetical protein RclHR1_11030002 [Rhizophagus clarus]|uniref:Uncharacterized protein n=1 Tax=Rhizophagus clarus TaxID=94130 RepID=A0A2Z6Q3J9_9GLOM|nr:hypothetical protein RclHR1_11030002 [Rhizophagus clarus]
MLVGKGRGLPDRKYDQTFEIEVLPDELRIGLWAKDINIAKRIIRIELWTKGIGLGSLYVDCTLISAGFGYLWILDW